MRTAVIGAAGLLGRVLFDALRKSDPSCVGTDWKGREGLPKLDLADSDISDLRLSETGHTWAVIAAVGSKRFDACEAQKAYTWERNVTGTVELGRRLHQAGIKVAYISTDAVFGGARGDYAENEVPDPINEYGRQKLAAEAGLLEVTSGRALIVRIGQLFGARKGDGTLPDAIAGQLASGKRVDAAHDQIFTPTAIDDVPCTLAKLQMGGASGIFHLTGPEPWTRLAVVERLADGLGINRSQIRRISLDEVPGNFARPKNLSLTCGRLKSEMGLVLTPASRCLDLVIDNYRAKEREPR